ncbi:MAG: M23 family metallopeptidase [Bacteroidales bacterium]
MDKEKTTQQKKDHRSFLQKLHNKYRLVIMNDDTLEKKLTVKMTRFNVFIFTGTAAVFLVVATIYLIAFTPLREYIPGYADFNTRQVLRELSLRTDSLEKDLRQKDLYIMNIRNIVEGREIIKEIPDSISGSEVLPVEDMSRSREDSLLRAEMEQQFPFEEGQLTAENAGPTQPNIHLTFFPPLKGMVSRHFDSDRGHFGVDIVADLGEVVKATLDGTVIFSTWTMETGYNIGIQHEHNLISVYKHNSGLLKEQGSFVEAGEAIAVIGDTGLYSTGTHLHFELWLNGVPINPLDYIIVE